ncbi:MAG: hypothetical protein Q7T03_11100 [Deltaproteobacteria bacterium]|nr:hypothetical protein [Deltaproteobacteria bacterium]
MTYLNGVNAVALAVANSATAGEAAAVLMSVPASGELYDVFRGIEGAVGGVNQSLATLLKGSTIAFVKAVASDVVKAADIKVGFATNLKNIKPRHWPKVQESLVALGGIFAPPILAGKQVQRSIRSAAVSPVTGGPANVVHRGLSYYAGLMIVVRRNGLKEVVEEAVRNAAPTIYPNGAGVLNFHDRGAGDTHALILATLAVSEYEHSLNSLGEDGSLIPEEWRALNPAKHLRDGTLRVIVKIDEVDNQARVTYDHPNNLLTFSNLPPLEDIYNHEKNPNYLHLPVTSVVVGAILRGLANSQTEYNMAQVVDAEIQQWLTLIGQTGIDAAAKTAANVETAFRKEEIRRKEELKKKWPVEVVRLYGDLLDKKRHNLSFIAARAMLSVDRMDMAYEAALQQFIRRQEAEKFFQAISEMDRYRKSDLPMLRLEGSRLVVETIEFSKWEEDALPILMNRNAAVIARLHKLKNPGADPKSSEALRILCILYARAAFSAFEKGDSVKGSRIIEKMLLPLIRFQVERVG